MICVQFITVNIIPLKNLVALLFLVLGQFIANAQKPAQKAGQVITLNLMPVGPIHLPKIKENNKGKNQQAANQVELPPRGNWFTDKQVIDTNEKVWDVAVNTPGRSNEGLYSPAASRSILYTVSPL
jgi:hypothetical protein